MQRFAGGAGIGNKRPPSPGAGGTSKIANIAGTPTRAGAKASKKAPSTGSQAVHFWLVCLALA